MRVKKAMLQDLGSRDAAFIQTVKDIRSSLIVLAKVPKSEYTSIPIQGSGTFAVEAAITTSVPKKGGKLLVIFNGAYGQRVCSIANYLGIETVKLQFGESSAPDLGQVEKLLASDKLITNVAAVHCETSSGMINPVEQIGQLIAKHNPTATYFVDAMSSFGAVPIDMLRGNIHFLVSSANKCIQVLFSQPKVT